MRGEQKINQLPNIILSYPQDNSQQLIFDPGGKNEPLLAELRARAKTRQIKKPFFITDVLLPDEMECVAKDFARINFKEQFKQLYRKIEQNLAWCKYERENREATSLPSAKAIHKVLTREILQQVQRCVKHPTELAAVIENIIKNAQQEIGRKGSIKANAPYKHDREKAIEIAKKQWVTEPETTKTAMAEYIIHQLKLTERVKLRTVEKWITSCMPTERQRGGRPRNNK